MTVTPNWDLVNLRGRFVGTNGVPIAGRVIFTPKAGRMADIAALTTIIGRAVAVTLDGTGAFSIYLPATDDPDITGNGFTYQVKEDFTGGSDYNIPLPISYVATGVDLVSLAPVSPNSGSSMGPVTRLEYDAFVSGFDPAVLAQVSTALTDVETAKTAAAGSATGAASSATAAGTSATNAASSATAAAGSATTANTSKNTAATSATAAGTSATEAATSATAAGTSASNAAGSASSAATSATNAAESGAGFATVSATSLTTGAAPTATVTGTAPNRNLNIGVPQSAVDDSTLTTIDGNAASSFRVQQDARLATAIDTKVPKWQASTAYALGATVLASDGSLVKAKVAFTSGATYAATNWTSVAAYTGTQAQTELSATFAVIPMQGPGIDYTGVTDSTTAMQAVIDAADVGSRILLGFGRLKFSTLTVPSGILLEGPGYSFARDYIDVGFGDVHFGWALWGGCVLQSTATTGPAITFGSPVQTVGGVGASPITGGGLAGFYLLGPGSGTSTGAELGADTVGGDAANLYPLDVRCDIGIGNFALGLQTRNLNEGTIRPRIRGCTKGASFEYNTNAVKIDLNIQRCADGASTDATTIGVTFETPIFQALTGTGLSIEGNRHAIVNPYSESAAGVRSIDFVSGERHVLIAPVLNWAADSMRIQAACESVTVIGHDPEGNWLVNESPSTITTAPQKWTTIASGVGFQNSWASGHPTTNVGRYRKSPDSGSVEIEGNITGGANGTVAFTLPTWARPTYVKYRAIFNASLETIGYAYIATNGEVTITGGTSSAHLMILSLSFPLD